MPTVIGPGKSSNYNNIGQGISNSYYKTAFHNRNPNLNYSIKNNKGQNSGFAFLKNFNNERYLYLIGAKKGMGGILLKRIINNARTAGKKTIGLEPVENAIYFYLKHGFIHKNNKMVLNLAKNHTNNIKKHQAAAKIQRKYRARPSVKKKAYKRWLEDSN